MWQHPLVGAVVGFLLIFAALMLSREPALCRWISDPEGGPVPVRVCWP